MTESAIEMTVLSIKDHCSLIIDGICTLVRFFPPTYTLHNLRFCHY